MAICTIPPTLQVHGNQQRWTPQVMLVMDVQSLLTARTTSTSFTSTRRFRTSSTPQNHSPPPSPTAVGPPQPSTGETTSAPSGRWQSTVKTASTSHIMRKLKMSCATQQKHREAPPGPTPPSTHREMLAGLPPSQWIPTTNLTLPTKRIGQTISSMLTRWALHGLSQRLTPP